MLRATLGPKARAGAWAGCRAGCVGWVHGLGAWAGCRAGFVGWVHGLGEWAGCVG